MSKSESRQLFLMPIVVGMAIVGVAALLYLQFEDNQYNINELNKEKMQRIIEGIIDRRESRVVTLASSIIAFFDSSDEVTASEFAMFVSSSLKEEHGILNIFVLQDNAIIHSYPHQEYAGNDFDLLFDEYPVMIDGIKTMTPQFFFRDDRSIIIALAFDYFISEDIIPSERYKVILYSPIGNQRLYEIERDGALIKKSDVAISAEEVAASIDIKKDTRLFGHKLGQTYDLHYTLWDESFQNRVTVSDIVFLAIGIAISITIPMLIYRANQFALHLKKQSAKMEHLNRNLIEADKTKEEFSAMVTHELKTPLVPIIGYCSMLKKKMIGDLNDEQMESIETMEKNAKHLETLVTNIMDVRKLDLDKMRFDIEDVSVDEFFADLASSYKKILHDKKIDFAIRVPVEGVIIKTDKTRFRQVFDNLISNAIKFVPEKNGRIEVGFDRDDKITFYVKDNGMGIPPDKQAGLFKKFYQVDTSERRKAGGTGLGLAICKGIMDKLGGKIWVDSDGKSGTTLYVTL